MVDLGVGCGIISLVLLLTKPVGYVVGLEIQASLAYQCVRNAMLNGFSKKMGVIIGDMRHPPVSETSVDVVVCNPPYRKKESGRINPDPQRAIAKHEILVSLDDILHAARSILRPKGRFTIIYPAERITDLIIRLREFGMEPKRMRVIYPNMTSNAKLAMVEAALGGKRGLEILSPLLDQGNFSISGQS